MPQAELQGTFGFCRWSAVANRTSQMRSTGIELALLWTPSQWLLYLLKSAEELWGLILFCCSDMVRKGTGVGPVGQWEAEGSPDVSAPTRISGVFPLWGSWEAIARAWTKYNPGEQRSAQEGGARLSGTVQCQSGRQQSASHGELGLAV